MENHKNQKEEMEAEVFETGLNKIEVLLAKSPMGGFGTEERDFLKLFQHAIFCYLGDANHALPAIHSKSLDFTRQSIGYGIFFSVNGFLPSEGGKIYRTEASLSKLNGLFVDFDSSNFSGFDKPDFSLRSYKTMVREELMALETFVPTAIIETKNGIHAHWLFSSSLDVIRAPIDPNNEETAEMEDGDLDLIERYKRLEAALVNRFWSLGADPQVKDPSRVLRVPGSFHLKDPNDPFLTRLVFFSKENRYPIEFLESKILTEPVTDIEGFASKHSEGGLEPEVEKELEKIYPILERPSYVALMRKQDGASKGLRNYSLLVCATACRRSGWSLEKTLEYFDEYNGLSKAQIEHDIRTAYKRPVPYDFGYKNPAIAPFVSEAEKVRFAEAVSQAYRMAELNLTPKLDENNLIKAASQSPEDLLSKVPHKDQQKSTYSIFEFLYLRAHPHLKYEINGRFFEYVDGVYKQIDEESMNNRVMQSFLEHGLLNFRKRTAVADKIACLKSMPSVAFDPIEVDSDPNLLNVSNGLVDIRTGELKPHDPKYISLSKLGHPYKQDAQCPKFLQFLDEVTVGDQSLKDLLQKIMGYCLTFDISHHKAFILYGDGRNGKGVFTRILSRIIGLDYVSNLGMKNLTAQFGLAALYRKKLNHIDEVSSGFFESDMIKKLVSGERIQADVKWMEPIHFFPTSKFIFTVNELPRINDQSVGFYERFILVPFKASFRLSPNTNLEEEIMRDEASGILNFAIEGLKKLREDRGFKNSHVTDEAMEEFRMTNSPLLEYLTEEYDPASSESYVKKSEFYVAYRKYCLDYGYKFKSLSSTTRELAFVRVTDPKWQSIKVTKDAKYIHGIKPKPQTYV